MKNSRTELPDIRKVPEQALKTFFQEKGEPAFRVKQLLEWIWKKESCDFGQMTNLSEKLRGLLRENYSFRPISVAQEQKSADGTIKFAFRLHDAQAVEGVLIPTESRVTACISSQVGCSLSCKFCATGYMKRSRNLDFTEIYDQVALLRKKANRHYEKPLSNIVFMGMGEPLLNYKNVLEGIARITSAEGLNISPKRITLSTAGIAKKIRQLGDDAVKFNLALSLHAANDSKRNQIMAINKTNNLPVLRDALKYYFSKTKNIVTFEYIVFQNFNDSIADAEELYRFTKHLPTKVNLIEYNPIEQARFSQTAEDKLSRFVGFLEKKRVNVKLRRSRGKDIDAACGQLAGKK